MSNTEDQLIRDDYNSHLISLKAIGEMHIKAFSEIEQVHALNYRVKDVDHLIKKVHRKQNEKNQIDVKNYKEKITDLIGIRILHKFKNNWEKIDSYIRENYKTVEKPIAYIRNGDSKEGLESFDIRVHDFGYRSLHYTVETIPQKSKYIMEIQVRTIFEEAWSEIDHTIRYPDILNNRIINEYSLVLNRLAGLGDEMVTNILNLRNELVEKEKETQKYIETMQISEKEKQKLKQSINTQQIVMTTMGVKLLYDLLNEKK